MWASRAFVAARLACGVVLAAGIPGTISCAGDGATASQGSGGSEGCSRACARCGSEFCLDCGATAARFRDDFESALYACVLEGDAACGTLWTSCAVRAEGQISRRPADDSYRDACLTKRSECEAQGTTFADDNCLLSSLMEEAVLAQANQCLAKSCAEIPSCLRPIFQ